MSTEAPPGAPEDDFNHPHHRRSEWGTGKLCVGLSPEQLHDCYRDQGPEHSDWLGRRFFSCLTPSGVRNLEGHIGERIRQIGTPAWESEKDTFRQGYLRSCHPSMQTVEELEQAIIESPHLHPVIKDNLLLNFKNYQAHEKA